MRILQPFFKLQYCVAKFSVLILLKKIIGSASALTFASVVEKAGSFLMVALLAKFLPVVEFGNYSMAATYGLAANVILYSGMQSIAFRCISAAKDKQTQLATYWVVVSKLVKRSVYICLLLAALPLFVSDITRLAGLPYLLVVLVVGIQCVTAPQIIQNSIWVANGRYRTIILFAIIKTALVVLICLLIYFLPSAKFRFIGELLLSAFLSAVLMANYFRGREEWRSGSIDEANREVLRLKKYGYSALISQFSYVVINGVDRLMVGHFLGASSVAIYTIFSQSVAVLFLVNSFNNAFSSEYFKKFSDGKSPGDAYRLSLKVYIYGSLLLLIYKLALVIWGRDIVLLIASKEYAEAGRLFHYGADIVFFYFIYIVFTRQLHATENGRSLTTITFVAGAINFALNWFFVAHFGVLGAVCASLIAYFYMAAHAYIKCRTGYPGFSCSNGDILFAAPMLLFAIANLGAYWFI